MISMILPLMALVLCSTPRLLAVKTLYTDKGIYVSMYGHKQSHIYGDNILTCVNLSKLVAIFFLNVHF